MSPLKISFRRIGWVILLSLLTNHALARSPEEGRLYALEGRAGFLIPLQVLDGPEPHLTLGIRRKLNPYFSAQAETGLDRTRIQALREPFAYSLGTIDLAVNVTQWTVPVKTGLVLHLPTDSPQISIGLLGGIAVVHARYLGHVIGGPAIDRSSRSIVSPTLSTRVDSTWDVANGSVVIGAGWQQVFFHPGHLFGSLEATGVVMEAGWRVFF